MKKLIIVVATLASMSTMAFADQNSENANRMQELRNSFMEMTNQMMDDEIMMNQMQMKRLTAYQRVLKQMMENENSSNNK